MERKGRRWRIAVCHDDDSIIAFCLLGIVDDTLEISATSAKYLNLSRSLLDALHFSCHAIELHDIDVLDTIMEEAIDDRIEMCKAIAVDRTADHRKARNGCLGV